LEDKKAESAGSVFFYYVDIFLSPPDINLAALVADFDVNSCVLQ